jgi:hypothetical protein
MVVVVVGAEADSEQGSNKTKVQHRRKESKVEEMEIQFLRKNQSMM